MNNKSGATALREYDDARRNVLPVLFGVSHQRRNLALTLDAYIARDGRTINLIAAESGVDLSNLSGMRRGKQGMTRPSLEALIETLRLTAYEAARLLCAAGFLPIEDDPVFTEAVCRLAERRGLTRRDGDDMM